LYPLFVGWLAQYFYCSICLGHTSHNEDSDHASLYQLCILFV
jgi:hypothetical protein